MAVHPAFAQGHDAIHLATPGIKAAAQNSGAPEQFLAGMTMTLANFTYAQGGEAFVLDLLDRLKEAITLDAAERRKKGAH